MLALTCKKHRLKDIDGEWHEFESKALRRENERKEKEARRAQEKQTVISTSGRERDQRDRKRPNESSDPQRESKRPHIESDSKSQRPPNRELTPAKPKPNPAQPKPFSGTTAKLPVGGHSKPEQASSSSAQTKTQ